MRVTEGSTPGRWRFARRSRRRGRRFRRALAPARRDRWGGGRARPRAAGARRLELHRAGRLGGRPTRRRSTAATAGSTRPAGDRARAAGPRPDPPHRGLPRARGRRAAGRARAAAEPGGSDRRGSRPATAGCGSAPAKACCGCVVSGRRRARDGRRRLPARPSGAPPRVSAGGHGGRARVAYEVLSRTFEDGAWTDRAFAVAADRARAQRPRAGPGATARLRRRAAPGDQRSPDRRPRRPTAAAIDAAALAALRLGLYELLFSDATPDHAAVDQAVELAKAAPARRGAAGAGAGGRRICERGAAAGGGGARRAARRARRLDPRGRGDRPLLSGWLARMWWDELGAQRGATR